jgi:hypothetical protein
MNLPRLPPHQNAFPKPSPLGVNYRSGFGPIVQVQSLNFRPALL